MMELGIFMMMVSFVWNGIINLLLMHNKKNKLYYNTPLNLSQTIDLPSNLLGDRPKYRQIQKSSLNRDTLFQQNNSNLVPIDSGRQQIEPIQPKKQENVMLIEEKSHSKRNVLYKRLTDIKVQNGELQKYSYSKLLSKMVIVDPRQQLKSVDYETQNPRTISEYSCLRGKLLNMDCKQQPNQRPKSRERNASGISDYASRTTRIFKRYYMPSSEKNNPNFFNQVSLQQKYIFINGKKTECKRIHNFYTSQNFRNSYDKAFGKTKDSFYSRKDRYEKDF